MEYSTIMSKEQFLKMISTHPNPDVVKEIMKLQVEVTEKIHGENFRIGKEADGRKFIGTKELKFYENDFSKHNLWSQFDEETKKFFDRIFHYIEFIQGEITFYGEAYGKGLQKYFNWDFDGIKVRYFEVETDGVYLSKPEAKSIIAGLLLPYVPVVDHTTLEKALNIDVTQLVSAVSNTPYVEGVVIVPAFPEDVKRVWGSVHRLVIKSKIPKFSEMRQGKPKDRLVITDDMAENCKWINYVTMGRIENVISHLRQTVEIKGNLEDLKYLVSAVVVDIEKEENEGVELSRADKKIVSDEIRRVYKGMLLGEDVDRHEEQVPSDVAEAMAEAELRDEKEEQLYVPETPEVPADMSETYQEMIDYSLAERNPIAKKDDEEEKPKKRGRKRK